MRTRVTASRAIQYSMADDQYELEDFDVDNALVTPPSDEADNHQQSFTVSHARKC